MRPISKHTYKSSGITTDGFLEVTVLELSACCNEIENEISEHYSIYWIEKGSGTYFIDFKKIEIENSGLFFLSPGQIFKAENENISKSYRISFDKEFYCVETHAKEIACNGILFNDVHKARFINIEESDVSIFTEQFETIIKEVNDNSDAQKDLIEAHLRILLIQALRRVDKSGSVSKEKASNDSVVAEFISLVDREYKKIHAVEDYASLLFISPKTLSKKLKQLNYKSPLKVIRDRIILQAKRELRYTKKTIKEIAFELGFEDPAYFTRLFKKAEDRTPLQYRVDYLK